MNKAGDYYVTLQQPWDEARTFLVRAYSEQGAIRDPVKLKIRHYRRRIEKES